MLKKAAKTNVCDKTIRRALLSKGIKFRRLRTKPTLTREDIKARLLFAETYKGKSVAWWKSNIHMIIDCKTFPAYTTARGRSYAAQREIRGVYRELGQGLDDAYVLAPRDLKFKPGSSAVKIVAGIGKGKVLLWHDYGKNWNGTVAAEVYKGPMLAALKENWPGRKSFNVLEDNDPTGG